MSRAERPARYARRARENHSASPSAQHLLRVQTFRRCAPVDAVEEEVDTPEVSRLARSTLDNVPCFVDTLLLPGAELPRQRRSSAVVDSAVGDVGDPDVELAVPADPIGEQLELVGVALGGSGVPHRQEAGERGIELKSPAPNG